MAQVDFARREITIKLVYYGPAMSGKTTNLQQLHNRLTDRHRSQLLQLETANDRTIFFDLLPIAVPSPASGLKVVMKLMTVPGQVMHNNTRRLVLRGADGVAFIADSKRSEAAQNREAYANLRANLKDNDLDPDTLPIVIQYNKRDLPADQICSDEELERVAQRGREPIITAAAIQGVGVLETFFLLTAQVWDGLEASVGLGSRHGIEKEELMVELGRRLQAEDLARQVAAG